MASQRSAIDQLGRDISSRWGDDGLIQKIVGDLSAVPDQAEARRNPDRLAAALWKALRLQKSTELVDPRGFTDAERNSVLRFGQKISGIPVFGAFLAIGYDPQGSPDLIRSHLLHHEGLATEPLIARENAEVLSIDHALDGSPSAVIHSANLAYLMHNRGRAELTWQVEVALRPEDAPPEAYRVFVNALNGQIEESHPSIRHARYRRVYSAQNTSNYTAQLLIEEGGSTNHSHGQAVYDNAGIAYDCFSSVHNLDSYDNEGAKIDSTVDFHIDTAASFDPTVDQLVFGNGNGTWGPLGESLDALSHEYTHAVTKYASGLIYQEESGAIDEAISDIFAATIDAHENGVSSRTWRIAEDISHPSDLSVAVRYMSDPTTDGNSRDDYQNRYLGDDDHGGVHWNSGIVNLAFYLMSEGGSHPDWRVSTVPVPGIGINKAAATVYRANRVCLPNDATMEQLRICVQDAASYLYGSSEYDTASRAFDAVRVPGSPNNPPSMPSSISTNSLQCYGMHSVSWGSSSSTNYYRLRFHQTRQYVESGSILYSGQDTYTTVNVPRDGYVGVTACNDFGCSSYNKSQWLQRLSSCQ